MSLTPSQILKEAEAQLQRLKGVKPTWPEQPGHVAFRCLKFRAPFDVLNDYKRIKKELEDLSKTAGMKPIAGVWKWFKPQGITGIVLLETSHVAIHTWPEDGVGYVSLATCNPDVDPSKALMDFVKSIKAQVVEDIAPSSNVRKAQALYLIEPHGVMIWRGEKTLIVKARKFDVAGKDYYLASGDKLLGMIRLKKPRAIDLDEFKKLENKHRISEDERKAWWPRAKKLWAYDIEEFEKFDPPRPFELPKGAQTFVRDVTLKGELTEEERNIAEAAVSLFERWGGEVAELNAQYVEEGNGVKSFLQGLPSLAEAASSELKNFLATNGGTTDKASPSVWETTREVYQATEKLMPFVAGRLRYILEDVLVWSKQLLALEPTFKAKYPVLKVPDPPYVIARMNDGLTAGYMSSLPRISRIGVEQLLVNFLKAGTWDTMFAWGIVKQGEPVEVGEFGSSSEYWDAVDEPTREEYNERKNVYFIPLELVEVFDAPVDLGKIAGRRFGPEVALKEDGPALNVDPETLAGWPDERLDQFRKELEAFFPEAKGSDREAVLNAAFLLKHEWERRGLSRTFGGELGEAMRALAKMLPDGTGFTAPIHPSGEEQGESLALEEVLRHVKPICLRLPCVTLVGGIANNGSSKNDVDLLIKGPFDENTEHVIRFRLGRMFPPNVSERIQFLDDEMGGPFTSHIDLYDLWLIPRRQFEIKEMSAVVEKADPLLEYPKGPIKKHESTLQFHFRGASLHSDLRIKIDDYLIGWTGALQQKGLPDVNTIAQGEALARQFDVDGSRVNKPFRAPSRIWATPKSVEPVEWLRIAPKQFEPGTVGATAEEAGVIIEVDRPLVEWGIQKAYYHEYFLTKSKHGFEGVLQFRLLTGERGASEEEQEAGRATEAGQPFWTCQIGKTYLPSVLRKRSVETKSMPPDGQSAMPTALMKITPEEFQFWKHKGAKAREVRDALVESKFFTEENVTMVNGEFARVEKQTKLVMSKEMYEILKVDEVPYVLSYQYWRGQAVVRAGPTKEEWHLTLDRDGSVDSWALQSNPLEAERSSAIKRDYKGKALLNHEGDVEPGKAYDGDVLNPTKDTPSRIVVIDHGKATLLEDSEQFVKLTFSGGKLKGTYVLRSEAGDLWVYEKSGPPGSPREER